MRDLRLFVNKLATTPRMFDHTIYYLSSLTVSNEFGYFRLPNQSKNSINKPAPPMRVIQGDIADFIVSEFDGLELLTLKQ
jgi:hypothetical protein